MKTLIVGGNFDSLDKKESGVINKIYNEFSGPGQEITIINGGLLSDLPKSVRGYDLVLWMPNIKNEIEKQYPEKDQGSVLICSKVMRPEYTRADSLARIFKLHGNAVIEISKREGYFEFILCDALGNEWGKKSCEIKGLVSEILKFYIFTKSAVRVNTKKIDEIPNQDLDCLIKLNKRLQAHITKSWGARFFGNLSTRCSKLFPSMRGEVMLVSPRNIDKESIEPKDMVQYTSDDSYIGDRKPSVDSPIQIRLYQYFPNINFMIHGHAIIEKAPTTENYRLCGDVREVNEIVNAVGDKDTVGFILNLKNHGFLIAADYIETLENIVIGIENGEYGQIKRNNS